MRTPSVQMPGRITSSESATRLFRLVSFLGPARCLILTKSANVLLGSFPASPQSYGNMNLSTPGEDQSLYQFQI